MSDEVRDDDLSAEGEGDSLGEAKWAAMKELEPRFPGITAECVQLRGDRGSGTDGAGARARGGGRGRLARGGRGDPGGAGRAGAGDRGPRSCTRSACGRRVDIEETEDEIRATVNGEDLGLLIGKHGTTIDAVQHSPSGPPSAGARSASR